MRRCLVFLPNWIGDVVMATPAIRALRDAYPRAELVAVCKPYVAETLAGAPWFNETFLFDKRGARGIRFWSVLQALRRRSPDTAVLFPNSFRAALLARLAGCVEVVGFARYCRDILLSKRLYPERGEDGRPKPRPVIDDYNRIVKLLNVPDPGHRMELFTTAKDEAAAEEFWNRQCLNRFQEVVAMNSGGAFGAAKLWPTPYFAELAKLLVQRRGAGVLMLCGPSERAIAAEVVKQAGLAEVLSIADESLSLGFTKALVRRSSLLITTDSGPRHFAAAFNRPVVSLFGPTHIAWTETYFPKAIHLQKPVPCGPCQLRVCPLDHKCMNTLLPMEVYAAAVQLLG